MGYVTENDYKKLADAVADDLVLNKIPLNDSIKKLASVQGLNQEQVRRLCEATNNVTFNKLFSARDKTAADRVIEFDVADPSTVLGGAIKEAAANYDDQVPSDTVLLSEFRSLRPALEKMAAAEEPAFKDPPTRPEFDRRTLRKTRDHMHHEKLSAEMCYGDALEQVRGQFRRLYTDLPFEEFEKKAAAIHGVAAISSLADLRKLQRLPEVNYDIPRLQKTAGYVDDAPLVFKLFSTALAYAEKVASLRAGIAELDKRAG